MILNSKRNVPVKALVALTALVALLHAIILQGAPMTLGLSQIQLPKAFITRTIQPVPPTAPQAEQPLPLPKPVQPKTKPATTLVNKSPPRQTEPLNEPTASSTTSFQIKPADKADGEDHAVVASANEEKTTPQLEASPELEKSPPQQPLAGESGSTVRSYSVTPVPVLNAAP